MRKGAEKRTLREDGKACIVQVLASEHVSQTSNNRHKSRGDENEAQDHPHYSHEVGLQMVMISGSAMSNAEPWTAASRVPIVVTDRAVHSYPC